MSFVVGFIVSGALYFIFTRRLGLDGELNYIGTQPIHSLQDVPGNPPASHTTNSGGAEPTAV